MIINSKTQNVPPIDFSVDRLVYMYDYKNYVDLWGITACCFSIDKNFEATDMESRQ